MNEERPRRTAWFWYTLLRLGIFAVVLTVLLLVLPVEPWISTILAAIISFCLSFLLLSRPRAELALQLDEARHGRRRDEAGPSDDEAEDAALDEIGNDHKS